MRCFIRAMISSMLVWQGWCDGREQHLYRRQAADRRECRRRQGRRDAGETRPARDGGRGAAQGVQGVGGSGVIWFLLAVAEPNLDAEIQACNVPADHRPLTLCLAERSFERADARLNAQWKITFPYVVAKQGRNAAQKLRTEQRVWIKMRDRKCDAIAIPTPVSHQGRNLMECLARMTDERTAVLRAMTGKQ
jgi:uncharacterized protein YecT (DUF1311 family)